MEIRRPTLDAGDDYVSMHHRIRRDLRRRLKHASVEMEKPVTDIVNEAILAYLDQKEIGPFAVSGLRGQELLDRLRHLKDEGGLYQALPRIEKVRMVEALKVAGVEADMRASGDRLISLLVHTL